VKAVNDAFVKGGESHIRTVLEDIFHQDMVIRGPELKLVAEGKKACIDSYVAFASAATILSFEGSEPSVDLFDDMATGKYSWHISYVMDGAECDQKGDEVFMFVREGGKWLAAWRAQGAAG